MSLPLKDRTPMAEGELACQAVLIAGPTASGKSGFAMRIAEARNGRVVNADSMQVYRDLRVLSARPSDEDEARVPHHMYGHVDGAAHYSTGHWAREIKAELADIWALGKLPVIVGGTGLYFSALVDGLSEVPTIPADVRNHFRKLDTPLEALRVQLATMDPLWADEAGGLDRQRTLRALEVLEGTGKSLKHWQAIPGQPILTGQTARFVIAPERDVLYDRINRRFDGMIGEGALEEVSALVARNLDVNQPVMGALGVPQLAEHLAGTRDRTEAIDEAKMMTRRYAKRQMTWLRRNMMSWKRIKTKENYSNEHEIFALIDQIRLTEPR